jgi:NADP-dependent 3-hydroxy acid dehydrogenase YdfG/acyl carrier protein
VSSLRSDVGYFLLALDTLVFEKPDEVAESLALIMSQVGSGELEPLPHTLFPIHAARDAFRYMAQAKHIGKVILDHDGAAKGADGGFALRDDATYLITGGFGGLGICLAQWLVDQGVRHLVLVGRRGPGEQAAEVLGTLEMRGARIVRVNADISIEEDLRRAIARIDDGMPPLKGIFHAAGVLDDGILVNQEWSRFLKVMAAKVLGAIYLDRLTQQTDLDFFVMFSSSASLLGFPGQGNYAAANSFLDAFAHYRQAQGRPAQSINWGPWDEIGMTAGLKRQWSLLGINTIKSDQGFDTLGLLLREKCPQVAVLPVEWSQIAQRFPNGEPPPLLSGMAREFAGTLEPSAEWIELGRRVADAPPAERKELIVQRLVEMGRGVLGLGSTQPLDTRVPLNDLGFDSLMAVELAKALGRTTGIAVPVTLLFDYPTFDALAGYFLDEILQPSNGHARPGSWAERKRRNISASSLGMALPAAVPAGGHHNA